MTETPTTNEGRQMDLDRLYAILSETTCQLRKGAPIEKRTAGPIEVTEVFAMPHESEARPELAKVDLEFVVVGVDNAAAQRHRDELKAILDTYPAPERLACGPSYIEVGAVIGDQGAAFQLFALGKVLGLWDVITPTTLGITGDDARRMAGSGMIMMTGYRPSAKAA